MKRIALIILVNIFLLNNYCFAKETVKLGASYQIKEKQIINLRVTQVPKKYPWIEKDLDGKTINPEYDSKVIAENIRAIEIKDEYGEKYTIPAGSKFFARVVEVVPSKSFWRKEKIKLDFYALAISDGKFDEYFEETSFQAYDGTNSIQPLDSEARIDFDKELSFDSRKDESAKDIIKNIAMLGGYTLGGAIAGPFMLFSISSIIGTATTISALSNPYVIGGAAAIGGAVGLTAGIMRKGSDMKIEPGQKIKISLDNTWSITKLLDDKLKNKSPLVSETINDQFILDILSVKKISDSFGDNALHLSIYFKNKTKQEITYTSFILIDSTGKAYEANVDDLSPDFFEGLPKEGTLRISFTVDYPDAPHQLKVLDSRSRSTLAYKQVILQ